MARRSKKKIIFVCTGNTCRSPMAELLLKERLKALKMEGFSVLSAGISAHKGDSINPLSKQVLSENGIDCEAFLSTKLTEKNLREAYAIVCMTEKQREILLDMRWNALRKTGAVEIENNVRSFAEITGYEVLDPYGKDLECYRYVFGLLSAGMSPLIEALELRKHAWEPVAKKKTAAKKTVAKKKK